MIKRAKFHLQSKYNILFPEQAQVSYPDFDPCRANPPVAIVHMPAIINTKEVVLTHCIHEDDQIY